MNISRLVVGEFEANCYIVKSNNELCVIDPGADVDLIVEKIRETGADLKYIINTHYHDDHSAGCEDLKRIAGGEILIHQAEKDLIEIKIDKFLDEGNELLFGNSKLTVIHTPGHSPGSICLLGDKNIFTGDTLFLNGCGRVDLLGGSEEELESSLLRLSKIVLSGMTVYPGHGESYYFDS